MNQREISINFINKLNDVNFNQYYRFFTKDSNAYLISLNQEVNIEEVINYLKKEIILPLEVKRILESKMFVKIETSSINQEINFYFEIKNRRIKRLEVEIVK